LAVPVAPPDTVAGLKPLVDEVVCLAMPDPFYAIGAHYREFHQLSDQEVVQMLTQARAFAGPGAAT
jgi:putative phosphoribosyl transferase